MHLLPLTLVLSATLFLPRAYTESDPCTTYKGTRGTCVNIKQCPVLLNLLKYGKPLSKNSLRRLNESQCGFEGLEPKVCCSSALAENDDPLPPQSTEPTATLSNAISDSSKQTSCKTTSGSVGVCIAINQCPSLYAILNREPIISAAALEILKQSHCEFEKLIPKVCCGDYQRPTTESTTHQITSTNSLREKCVTPRGTYGTCINIKRCQPLFRLFKQSDQLSYEVLQTLRQAHCGFENEDPKVCCENEQPSLRTSQDKPTEKRLISLPPEVTDHPNLGLLDHDLCGPILEIKIIGGKKARVFEFPWMALIAYDTGSEAPEFRCGGALITKKHVLTAAHCVTGLPRNLELFGVRLGEHDLSTERDCDIDVNGLEMNCAEDYQDFSILGVAVHPDYPRDKLQEDIALIMLDGEANFQSANVRPICLPVGLTSILNRRMTVTGWGATESGPRSNTLQKVALSIVPNQECARLYKMRNIKIWHKQVCAGGSNRTDSCSGDSGGPLQALGMHYGKPKNILYGIVSFGPRNCGAERVPGVYTRVEYYMDWILDSIGTDIYDD